MASDTAQPGPSTVEVDMPRRLLPCPNHRQRRILALLLCLAIQISSAHAQLLRPGTWQVNGPVTATASNGTTIYLGGEFTEIQKQVYVTGPLATLDYGTNAPVTPFADVQGTIY